MPLQSINMTWQSLRMVKGGPHWHPLNVPGAVHPDKGALVPHGQLRPSLPTRKTERSAVLRPS